MDIKSQNIIDELSIAIKNSKTLEDIKQLRSLYVSKSIFLNELQNQVREVKDIEEKKEIGSKINEYRSKIIEIINNKEEELKNSFLIEKRKNPLLENHLYKIKIIESGVKHPLTKLSKIVLDYFYDLNYKFINGMEVEDTKYNFDVLNISNNHPSRSESDSFYLENGKMLRTHSTNVTARELENTKNLSVLNIFSMGSVFRNDDNDATHSFQFNQIDIFSIDSKNISISNLKWTLNNLLEKVFGKKLTIRYRVSYFPFTEPSFEIDIKCQDCNKHACSVCRGSGWIEILGSGMISPLVFEKTGHNINNIQGFAAGVGLERLAMLKWNIKDIRNFYINDLIFLRRIK